MRDRLDRTTRHDRGQLALPRRRRRRKARGRGYYARAHASAPSGSSPVTVQCSPARSLPAWSELQRVPGLVLVAGSGPTDRNGNNPLVPSASTRCA